jgi:hypothetical protein
MGASRYSTLEIEIAIGLVFSVSAVSGFKKSMWLAAAGIAGHGFFDFFVHHAVVTNSGMPVWWPGFCGTIDILLGGWLATCLWKTPKSSGVGANDHAQDAQQRTGRLSNFRPLASKRATRSRLRRTASFTMRVPAMISGLDSRR